MTVIFCETFLVSLRKIVEQDLGSFSSSWIDEIRDTLSSESRLLRHQREILLWSLNLYSTFVKVFVNFVMFTLMSLKWWSIVFLDYTNLLYSLLSGSQDTSSWVRFYLMLVRNFSFSCLLEFESRRPCVMSRDVTRRTFRKLWDPSMTCDHRCYRSGWRGRDLLLMHRLNVMWRPFSVTVYDVYDDDIAHERG
jgi:hypothetical protein